MEWAREKSNAKKWEKRLAFQREQLEEARKLRASIWRQIKGGGAPVETVPGPDAAELSDVPGAVKPDVSVDKAKTKKFWQI